MQTGRYGLTARNGVREERFRVPTPTDVMRGKPLFRIEPPTKAVESKKPASDTLSNNYTTHVSPDHKFISGRREIPGVVAVVSTDSSGKVIAKYGKRASDLRDDMRVVAKMYEELAARGIEDARTKYGKKTDCMVAPSIPVVIGKPIIEIDARPKVARKKPESKGKTDVAATKPMFTVDHTAELDALIEDIARTHKEETRSKAAALTEAVLAILPPITLPVPETDMLMHEPTKPYGRGMVPNQILLPFFEDDDTVPTASLRTTSLAPKPIGSTQYDFDNARTIPGTTRAPVIARGPDAKELTQAQIFNAFTGFGSATQLPAGPKVAAKPKSESQIMKALRKVDKAIDNALTKAFDAVESGMMKIASTLDGVHRRSPTRTAKGNAPRKEKYFGWY
jgi:hypothetical protein